MCAMPKPKRRTRQPHQGSAETNLLRSNLFQTCDHGGPYPAPVNARTLLGRDPTRASRRLSVPDLAALAKLCALLPARGCSVKTSWGELANSIYEQSGGKQSRLVHESLDRISDCKLTMYGYNFGTGQYGGISSGVALIQGYWWQPELRRRGLTLRQETGAAKGTGPLEVTLAEWLATQVRAGYTTWLDLDLLRKLGRGLAARLWAYLESLGTTGQDPALKPCHTHEHCVQGSLGLGQPALATLSLDGYGRHIDARRALARAAERIVDLDPAWESITIAKRLGWQLVYHRATNPQKARRPEESRWRTVRLATKPRAGSAVRREALTSLASARTTARNEQLRFSATETA